MADFIESFKRTDAFEGGWCDTKSDHGGETYHGISRKFFPLWPGWVIVDQMKSVPDFPKNLATVERLPRLVQNFYKTNFWDPIKGDLIPNQTIAEEMYDTAVNCGRGTSTRFLQESLNALNNQEYRWPDIECDGVMGKTTLKSLELCLEAKLEDVLLILMNGRQIDHYYQLMLREPAQEKFAISWLRNRCKLGG
jgi:lysozyme family protein